MSDKSREESCPSEDKPLFVKKYKGRFFQMDGEEEERRRREEEERLRREEGSPPVPPPRQVNLV